MLTIHSIETNAISGMTDLSMTFHYLGKAEAQEITKSFLSRKSAVVQVRLAVDQYFKNNIERFIRAIYHIDDQFPFDRITEKKRRALTIIEKYHDHLFSPDCTWPETLRFYLRIQSEFRKVLPGRKNQFYNMLLKQVEEFERLSDEFLTEFVQEGDQLMAKYQPQSQAS